MRSAAGAKGHVRHSAHAAGQLLGMVAGFAKNLARIVSYYTHYCHVTTPVVQSAEVPCHLPHS